MKSASLQPIRICLTFDDGPCPPSKSAASPTAAILDVLATEQICAAFFVLTGPDRWLWQTYPKGETLGGFELMVRTAKEGHLLACHGGGRYGSQLTTHPLRLYEPAYEVHNDGVILKQTDPGNALETDLLSCRMRIAEAYAEAGLHNCPISFVRPTLWKYKLGEFDARPTYQALDLSMILTDVKLNDGGYITAGIPRPAAMIKRMLKLVRQGERDVVVTLHDSNRITASRLPRHIAAIRKAMERHGYHEGKEWTFTQSREEVSDLFQRKLIFHQTGYVRTQPYESAVP